MENLKEIDYYIKGIRGESPYFKRSIKFDLLFIKWDLKRYNKLPDDSLQKIAQIAIGTEILKEKADEVYNAAYIARKNKDDINQALGVLQRIAIEWETVKFYKDKIDPFNALDLDILNHNSKVRDARIQLEKATSEIESNEFLKENLYNFRIYKKLKKTYNYAHALNDFSKKGSIFKDTNKIIRMLNKLGFTY